MNTKQMQGSGLSELRLMQLISPTLPIGAFTYSQGLEYAVECGWVTDSNSLESWLDGLLITAIENLELPVLLRLYQAILQNDLASFDYWATFMLASRETSELRQEDVNRAVALMRLLPSLGVIIEEPWYEGMKKTQCAPFALASASWSVPINKMALGYAWSWLENQVAAAVKLIPLGQTQGQQVQYEMSQTVNDVVEKAMLITDENIGASAPAVAIASSLHETQYTRLFRS